MSKRKYRGPKLLGQWVPHPAALIWKLRQLSITARRILHFEQRLSGLTSRRGISRGLRELEKSGFIKIQHGKRAYADIRLPSVYTLTYLHTFENGEWVKPTHDWKKNTGAKNHPGAGAKESTGNGQIPGPNTTLLYRSRGGGWGFSGGTI